MEKELCSCGKEAFWCYMPGFSSGCNSYFCDDCISSVDDFPCSCKWRYSKSREFEQPEGIEGKDWKWVEHEADEVIGEIKKEEGIWFHLDERGRPYPCEEYWYDPNGFEKD